MPTAVITGANRGLGLELTRQYLADGWRVITIVRQASTDLEKLHSGDMLEIIIADLVDDDSLQQAANRITDDKIDLLINNAGTMGDGSFAEAGMDYQAFGGFNRAEWQRIFEINVFTPMALSELLAARLEAADAGRVVTLSSMVGSNAWNTIGNLYPYRASKAAVNSIMRSMGINLAPRGIIAVAIQPGWIRTDMGGPNAPLDAPESMQEFRTTIANLTLKDAGKLFSQDGSEAPY